MKNIQLQFIKITSSLIFIMLPFMVVSQTTLSIFNDTLYFEQVSMGLIPPDAGMGIGELTFGTEFNRSFLRPHELRLDDGGIKAFYCNALLNNFELNFNFDQPGDFEIDWTLAKEFDPLYFSQQFTFARDGGGGAFSIKPISIKADTTSQESYLFLDNRIGVNVDESKVNRIAVFAKTDNYASNILGSIQAYKKVSNGNGAAITGTANEFGDDSPFAENILTSTGNLAGYTLGMNVAVHGHDYNGEGAGVIGSTLGTHQNPNIWGGLGIEGFAVWSNGEQFSTTNTVWSTSDARLKKQIKSQSKVLEKVLSLSPRQYFYTNSHDYKSMTFPTELQHGFLAQEVEKVFPELVREVVINNSEDGSFMTTVKAINYNGFFSILTSALQESHLLNEAQNHKVKTLEASNLELQVQLNQMKSLLSHLSEKVEILITDKAGSIKIN